MTHVTVELTPDIAERLRLEAQRQDKTEDEVIQAMFQEYLAPVHADDDTPLYLTLTQEVQKLVAQMDVEAFLKPPSGTPEDTIRLLQSWSEEEDDDDEGEGTWEDVLRAIDANRTSYRKLFPELEQPE